MSIKASILHFTIFLLGTQSLFSMDIPPERTPSPLFQYDVPASIRFWEATEQGNFELIKEMLSQNPKINLNYFRLKNGKICSPFDLANLQGNATIAKWLFDHGAYGDLSKVRGIKYTQYGLQTSNLLHKSAAENKLKDVLGLLQLLDNEMYSGSQQSMKRVHVNMLYQEPKSGVEKTALDCALEHRNEEMAYALLGHGAKLAYYTPQAFKDTFPNIPIMTLPEGDDPTIKLQFNYTLSHCFWLAAMKGDLGEMMFLYETGVVALNVQQQYKESYVFTPSDWAVFLDNREMLKWLCQHGGWVFKYQATFPQDKYPDCALQFDGRSCYYYWHAASVGKLDGMYQILEEIKESKRPGKINPNLVRDKKSALDSAVESKNITMVKLLLGQGAKLCSVTMEEFIAFFGENPELWKNETLQDSENIVSGEKELNSCLIQHKKNLVCNFTGFCLLYGALGFSKTQLDGTQKEYQNYREGVQEAQEAHQKQFDDCIQKWTDTSQKLQDTETKLEDCHRQLGAKEQELATKCAELTKAHRELTSSQIQCANAERKLTDCQLKLALSVGEKEAKYTLYLPCQHLSVSKDGDEDLKKCPRCEGPVSQIIKGIN